MVFKIIRSKKGKLVATIYLLVCFLVFVWCMSLSPPGEVAGLQWVFFGFLGIPWIFVFGLLEKLFSWQPGLAIDIAFCVLSIFLNITILPSIWRYLVRPENPSETPQD